MELPTYYTIQRVSRKGKNYEFLISTVTKRYWRLEYQRGKWKRMEITDEMKKKKKRWDMIGRIRDYDMMMKYVNYMDLDLYQRFEMECMRLL